MIVSFVLPVFNCEGNIKPLFTEMKATAAKFPMFQPEYIFVDDHSTDGSLNEIQALDSPFVKIVGLNKNVGSYSAALRGLSHVTGARVVVMAADGQDDPVVAYNLIGMSGENNMAAAYRTNSTSGLLAKLFRTIILWLSKPFGSGKVLDIVVFPAKMIPTVLEDERCNAHLFYGLDVLIPSKFLFKHEKRKRMVGKSGWTVGKKLKLAFQTIWGFAIARIRS